MSETLLVVVLVLLGIVFVLNAVVLLFVFKKKGSKVNFDTQELEGKITHSLDSTAKGIKENFMMTNEATTRALFGGLKSTTDQVVDNVKELSRNNELRLSEMKQELQVGLKDMKAELTSSLNKVREDNTVQLEKIRGTVDEKLTKTLDERFQESFKSVLESLDKVYKNLGELKTLDTGLNELTRMLSGSKTRGNWGELSLEGILSDVLVPSQYETQSKMGRRVQSDKVVDFAIILPGAKDDKVYLPIDAKFPVADFIRMKDALGEGRISDYQNAKKALSATIKHQAVAIKDKYISPPNTTDFAVMFLPIESLYAEVISIDGLVERIQDEYKVLIAGPNNITAFLNSLRLGFRTLKIQKESREIYKVLEDFKKSFTKFVGDLEKAQDHLIIAQRTIDDAKGRTRKIQEKLSKTEGITKPQEVEEIPGGDNE